ncbi:MAG: hypothetical protein JXA69_15100 [Phycisphaerae bacterium]|nr:hypothetical protein [Phycisphaerae bacterium]
MNKWQQGFSQKMGELRTQWTTRLDAVAEAELDPVFEEFTEFMRPWDFRTSKRESENAVRTFKFALDEEAYVLLFFRRKGVDGIECQHECVVPGQGRSEGKVADTGIRSANREWAESCFQQALDQLVAKLTETERARDVLEPMLVG